jgi:uncharacterized protein YecE (DUF72 family)
MAEIRVGIGGWNFAPWRGIFYPKGLPQAKELEYASRHVTAIEINSTFYRTQSPELYRRWAAATPEGFVFSAKAHRVVTHRKLLADAGPSIAHFLDSGILELGAKLGPVVWQFAPTKKFEPGDLEAFLKLLPATRGGHVLRHVLEVRHESFRDPRFIALARQHGCAICVADSDDYPLIADMTADFVYLRLQRSAESANAGYAPKALDLWAKRIVAWRDGGAPPDVATVGTGAPAQRTGRDCFVYFIAGAKEKNPAAAVALMHKLGKVPEVPL